METDTTIADQNTERLIQAAYQPELASADFSAHLEVMLTTTARALAKQATTRPPVRPKRWQWAVVIGGIAACVLFVFIFSALQRQMPKTPVADAPGSPKAPVANAPGSPVERTQPNIQLARWTDDVRDGMAPRRRPDAKPLATLKEGQTLTTKAGQRRLVQLGDGTRLYVNEKTEIEVSGPRQLTLHKGQIYLEVAPTDAADNFVVKTANREMTATGTHFAVMADAVASGVVVTQGKVAVKGIEQEVTAGQRVAPGASNMTAGLRASHTLEWTRELMAASETPMVPACEHAGGALLAVDPQGQEIKLSLRQYHIDVHIEDGFARTTIDQTYFNTTWERLEGTFYFPLPADASLSRLAMYVVDGNNQCKLMEGGMAERKHAADVYETIRYQRRDPALLEWLDGTTFKMRVFPLEAKQEKRIILSYTQKLPSLYGHTRYRFAGGLNMPMVRQYSFNARIKGGAGMNITCPSHEDMVLTPQAGDALMRLFANKIEPKEDVVLEMEDRNAAVDKDVPRFATFLHEGQQYLMLRYRPDLPNMPQRQRRDWIVLFESSASRDPIVAGTQVDVLKQILKGAEYDDTFTLLTVNSKVQAYSGEPSPVRGRVPEPGSLRSTARRKNVADAVKFLQETHLVGALDLQQGLQAAIKLAKDAKNPHLLHIGSGIPAMGERDSAKLARMLPENMPYVGVGVGKRWNRAFMKAAAERTNGLFTQINPDEVIAWRAFELLSTLNTPRLLDVQVTDAAGKAQFLMETSMLAQGEELCALTRVDTAHAAMPGNVVVKGTYSSPLPTGGEGPGVRGKLFTKEFTVQNVLSGAGYLPRTWAKLQIDRLLAANAGKHKDEIISLSKAMYVMSPFTSLLVLETDADYERFKVDRGRKDHWAMYQCPPKIPQVYEPDGNAPPKVEAKKKGTKPTCDEVLGTMVVSGGRGYAVPFRDILARVGETRTGSLMLGSGINPDNGVVGSIWLNELKEPIRVQGLPESIDFYPPALALDVSAGSRIHTSIIGGNVGGRRKRLEAAASLNGGSGRIQFAPVFFISPEMLLSPPGVPAKPGDHRTPIMAPMPVSDLFVPTDKRRLVDEFEMLEHTWTMRAARTKDKSLGDIARKMSNIERRLQLSRESLGEVIIVGNTVTQDRVIRRMVQGLQAGAMGMDGMGMGGMSIGSLVKPSNMIDMDRENSAALTLVQIMRTRQLQAKHDSDVHANESDFLAQLSGGLDSSLANTDPGFGERTRGRSLKQGSFRYERPQFEYDRTLFTDLVQYAPGLQSTWADILATLEAEADVEAPKLGAVDAEARKLIDKARSGAWQSLTIAAQGPIPGYKIVYNGIGQFAYERLLVSGLTEQVVCDGKTLWHLYPEIGLASKRPFSRHHQQLVAAINPAFLPDADELARGCEVKAIDANTIALVPALVKTLTPGPSPGGRGEKYGCVHLVFAKDGRLSERRIVETPGGKILFTQIFHADGSIEWKDADGKQIAKETRAIAPASAPSVQPNVRELVVIKLPLRTRDYILSNSRKLEESDQVADLFISECLNANIENGTVMRLFGKFVRAKGDRRLGYYTLINAAGFAIDNKVLASIDGKEWSIDIEKEHPNSALAMFLAEAQRELKSHDPKTLKNLPGPKNGFIQRMAQFRERWQSWHHQKPLLNGGADMPLELAKTIEFLNDTPSPAFAYAVLDTMQRRGNRPPTDHMLDIAVKRFGPIADPLGLGYVFRYEHARSLSQAGRIAESAKEFRALHADTLKYGIVPPIDVAFRDVLQMPIGDGEKFIGYTRKTLDDLLGKKRYGNAFQLAKQMEQLGDDALADEILTTILAKASTEEKNGLTLVSINFHSERKNFVQADRLLAKLLEDKKLAGYSRLWRWRAELTKNAGQTAASIACLEKALELEYTDLPELVNLESIRTDYRTLLNHYQRIAEATQSLEKPALKTFLAKVIRTADRWRLIDKDASEPSLLAGKILHTMGQRDLAWDYWTTPIDLHPAESRPWLELAESMKTEGDLDRADQAFGFAFEAEPTNPEILWRRAQNLVQLGQPDRARQLYGQIADGQWQERFSSTIEQARGLAK